MHGTVPILCYHKVGHQSSEGRWLCVAPEVLDAHIRFLKRRYQFFLASSWKSGLGRGVVLTFDDAYLSALTRGLEVLRLHGVCATFFAVSSAIGGSSIWDDVRAAPLAGHDLLQAAISSGCEVAVHTASHKRLTDLALEAQLRELTECQEAFEPYGYRTDWVAYPYGAWNIVTLEAAKSSGMKGGFGLGNLPAQSGEEPLAVPRIVVSYGDKVPKLWYKISVRPRLDRRLRCRYWAAKNMQ